MDKNKSLSPFRPAYIFAKIDVKSEFFEILNIQEVIQISHYGQMHGPSYRVTLMPKK